MGKRREFPKGMRKEPQSRGKGGEAGTGRADETFFKAFLAFSFSILEVPLLSAATVPIAPTGTWK